MVCDVLEELRITGLGVISDATLPLGSGLTVITEGRSRAHVGGRAVPVSVLADLGEQAVAVHGQSDQLRLLRPAEQRAALDRFAGEDHEKLLGRFHELYGQWRTITDDLADRRRNARERRQEADLLRLGLDEITRVDPQPGEDEALREEARRLEHVEGLRTAAQLAHQALSSEEDDAPDAAGMVGTARRTLEAQAGVDRTLGDVDGVIAWAERARARLAELDTSDEQLEEMDRERRRLAGEVGELAGAVSAS